MHNLYIFTIFIFVSSDWAKQSKSLSRDWARCWKSHYSIISPFVFHLPPYKACFWSIDNFKPRMEISGDRTLQLPTTYHPGFYLVFSSASSELFSRLYLTGFDCVRLTYVLSVHPDILNPSKLYLLFCLLVFSIFHWSNKISQQNQNKLKQHQLTLTKALKAFKTMDFVFNKTL